MLSACVRADGVGSGSWPAAQTQQTPPIAWITHTSSGQRPSLHLSGPLPVTIPCTPTVATCCTEDLELAALSRVTRFHALARFVSQIKHVITFDVRCRASWSGFPVQYFPTITLCPLSFGKVGKWAPNFPCPSTANNSGTHSGHRKHSSFLACVT